MVKKAKRRRQHGVEQADGYSQTYYFTKQRKGRSAKPTLAGVLLIIIGVLGLLTALFFGGIVLAFSTASHNDNLLGNIKVSFLGQVTDTQGSPVEGAKITILDSGISTTSDDAGLFLILNLPFGFTEVRIEKSGYITQQYTMFLNDNDNINLSEFVELKEQWLEEREEWLDDPNGYDYYSDDDYYDGNDYDYYGRSVKDFEDEKNYEVIKLNPGTGFDKTDHEDIDKIFSGIGLVSTLCVGIVLIASLLTLGGGILSVMRKGYGLAILGSIAGLFTLVFPLSLLFCVIAFFLLVLSYDDFNSTKRRPYKSKKRKVTWKGYRPPPPYK